MAKVSDLILRVNSLLDDTPSSTDLLDWFNQCQETLTSILYMTKKATISKASGVFPLPSDFNSLIDVRDPSTVTNLEIIDNSISFDEIDSTDSITIVYTKLLADMANATTFVPELPKQFHQIYVHYACMQAMQPEEEPERYSMYEREYLRMYGEIKKYMDKLKPSLGCWAVTR